MPGEGRSLRSGKDTSSSTNGQKARSNSQSSSSKDKPVPTRASATKGKAAGPGRKGSKKEASGDKPHLNGGPVENGVNGSEDVDMIDETSEHPKSGAIKDAEGDMTVVVPPAKGSKLSGDPGQDAEGDIDMNDTAKSNDHESKEVAVDPKQKAVNGRHFQGVTRFAMTLTSFTRYQRKLPASRARGHSI